MFSLLLLQRPRKVCEQGSLQREAWEVRDSTAKPFIKIIISTSYETINCSSTPKAGNTLSWVQLSPNFSSFAFNFLIIRAHKGVAWCSVTCTVSQTEHVQVMAVYGQAERAPLWPGRKRNEEVGEKHLWAMQGSVQILMIGFILSSYFILPNTTDSIFDHSGCWNKSP